MKLKNEYKQEHRSKRNSLCLCGSNKKYKKCCLLKLRAREAAQREYEKAMKYAAAKCPCGSGKKFGECCLNIPEKRQTELTKVV
jgi:uncharacterized protein YchJ